MLPYLFVLLAIAVRFLPFAGSFIPHAWHFTPLGASLLFFGARVMNAGSHLRLETRELLTYAGVATSKLSSDSF